MDTGSETGAVAADELKAAYSSGHLQRCVRLAPGKNAIAEGV